jgi:hypothetical protein
MDLKKVKNGMYRKSPVSKGKQPELNYASVSPGDISLRK